MIKELVCILFRQAFPVELGSLQKREGTHYIGACECKRIFDTSVNMAFSSQMDDTVNVKFSHELLYLFKIADIRFNKSVIGSVFDILQIGQITGISQLIQIDDMVIRVFVDK